MAVLRLLGSLFQQNRVTVDLNAEELVGFLAHVDAIMKACLLIELVGDEIEVDIGRDRQGVRPFDLAGMEPTATVVPSADTLSITSKLESRRWCR